MPVRPSGTVGKFSSPNHTKQVLRSSVVEGLTRQGSWFKPVLPLSSTGISFPTALVLGPGKELLVLSHEAFLQSVFLADLVFNDQVITVHFLLYLLARHTLQISGYVIY